MRALGVFCACVWMCVCASASVGREREIVIARIPLRRRALGLNMYTKACSDI